MKIKHMLALFMLFVYGLSFAHDVIPHHNHASETHHHAEAHEHSATDCEPHSHIHHENHFDNGLLDYLGCILGDHQHDPTQECELSEININQKTNASQQLVVVALSPSNTCKFAQLNKTKVLKQYSYYSIQHFLGNCARRGPPSLS